MYNIIRTYDSPAGNKDFIFWKGATTCWPTNIHQMYRHQHSIQTVSTLCGREGHCLPTPSFKICAISVSSKAIFLILTKSTRKYIDNKISRSEFNKTIRCYIVIVHYWQMWSESEEFDLLGYNKHDLYVFTREHFGTQIRGGEVYITVGCIMWRNHGIYAVWKKGPGDVRD